MACARRRPPKGVRMRRRDFMALLGSAAATWPLAAHAQQPAKMPRIGILDDAPMWQAFRQALRELGYVEGQNIAYEYRYGEGAPDRLATAAAELVRDARGQAGDGDRPHRDDRRRRSGAGRPGREPRPAGREYHRQYGAQPRPRTQTAANPARGHRERDARGLSRQSG